MNEIILHRLQSIENQIEKLISYYEIEQVCNLNEAASKLSIDYRTVKKLIKNGHLSTTADGRKVKVKSVIEYMNQN